MIREIYRIMVIFLLGCITLPVAYGQSGRRDIHVSGTVVDEKGETLPGCNIYIKNEPGVGTVTDIEGAFNIKVSKNDIIVFHFIGYNDQEKLITQPIQGLKIKLTEVKEALEEVVVVGHGEQRKVSVVGAINSVRVEDLNVPSSSISNTLTGRVPGIIGVQRSGEPGSDFSQFWIRGISTFGANASALILIDGVERSGIDQIDPEDIESFSVLKDASATAVYGVRGANGVVLITTKKGKAGKLSIRFKAYGTLSYSPRMPDYVNAYDYARLANEAKVVRGGEPLYNEVEMDIIKNHLDPDLYPDVNWQDEILKKFTWNHSEYLNISGGGSVARYFLSAGLYNSDALYKENGLNNYNTNVRYNKYTFRSNLDINVTKTTTVTLGIDGYMTKQNRPGIGVTSKIWEAQANLTPLTVPIRYSSGELPAYGSDLNQASPAVLLNHTGYQTVNSNAVQSNISVKQDFSQWVKGLSARVLYSFDTYTSHTEDRSKMPDLFYANKRKVTGGLDLQLKVDKKALAYTTSSYTSRKTYLESAIDYNRLFGERHRIGGLLHYFHQSETSTNASSSTDAIPRRNQGLSGRVTYAFDDKYFLEANFGYTGSENFKHGEQFGFFPSIAAGWAPSSYPWFQHKLPFVHLLKFRYSYGLAGNDEISNRRFPYFTFIDEEAAAGWGGTSGITESELGADNLRWEKAIKQNFGIDLAIGGFETTIDIFQDRRKGIFQERTNLPATVGNVTQPYGNVGTTKSHGVDATMAYTHHFNKNTSATLRGNFTYARNMIEYWEEPSYKYPYLAKSKHLMNSLKGLIALGLFESEEEIKSSPKHFGNVQPGDIKYKDINGDGKLDYDDYVFLDYSTIPQINYGIAGEFTWRNWTFSIFFQGAGKVRFLYDGNGYYPFNGGNTGNVLSIVNNQANRWTPASYSGDPSTENPNARFPRLNYGLFDNNQRNSTFWLANSRYLRLKNIEISYRLKARFLQAIALESIDMSLMGENLHVWDSVKLWDPEQASSNGSVYPLQRKFTFSLSLNF